MSALAEGEGTMEAFDLSYQQRRAWSLHRPDRGLAAQCVAQCALRIDGALDRERLARGLAETARRHEILRTRFHRKLGLKLPFQVVDGQPELELRAVDGDGLDELLATERTPFDFERGPLVRAACSESEDNAILVLTLPAVCGDQRTLELLALELLERHEGRELPPGSEEPLQYADFAAWQRELVETEDDDRRRATEHWARLDPSRIGALGLPWESPVSEDAGFESRSRRFALGAETAAAVERLAEREGVSVATVVLACWVALLGRRSGAEELVVGTLSDGRSFEELRDGLGPFAHYLPLILRPAEEMRFSDLLVAVREEERRGRESQDYAPLDPESGDGERAVRLPFLFDVELRGATRRVGRLAYRVARTVNHMEPFKLKVTTVLDPEGLALEMHHDTAVYPDAEGERLGRQLVALLEGAVADPDARIGTIESLAPDERRLLTDAFDRTGAGEPASEAYHRRFEAWARNEPDRPAIVAEGSTTTYGELDRRADGLARHLRELGVGPESRVVLVLPRTPDMVAALLGVLKAGGAYVPLDPAFPPERIALMLEEAEAAAVVTVEELEDLLPGHPAPRIFLDRDLRDRDPEEVEAPRDASSDGGIGPERLMYVVFTSGSTGRPKGVAVEHRQVESYLRGIAERLDLGRWAEGATFSFLSTFAADLGNTALLPALAFGGRLHLPPAEHASDPAALADAFRRHPADSLKIVPSHLAALLAASDGASILPRRSLVIGGEAAGAELLAILGEAAPELTVINHYGPTETTVGVLAGRVDRARGVSASGKPYLGAPLAGSRIHVLNRELRPVPAGVTGQISVGGRSLARCYLGRPAATARSFVPDPFSGGAGARLYATGDLARFTPEGDLEFLGRADGQVKLRGNRIELGEIESVLARHPEVWEVAVVLGEAPGGGEQIVAYVVPRRGSEPSADELKACLRDRLPDYMTPSAVVFLEALPLLPTGKVDRRSLPAPETLQSEGRGAVMMPRTLVELELVQMWEELLGIRPIGTDESFFTLGGHSLLAVRLMARIERRLGRNLPLATLYQTPTVAELAEAVEADAESTSDAPLVVIQAAEGRPPFFCVHPMGGQVLCYYQLSRALGADQPFYGLQASGLDLPEGAEPTIEEMAARYAETMVETLPEGPYLLGGYSFGSKVAFEMAGQLLRQGREVALLALLDGGAPGKRAQLDTVDEAVLVAQAFREEARQTGRSFPVSLDTVLEVEPGERLTYVVEQAKEHGFLAREVGVEMVREYARGVRDRQRASELYLPDVYSGRVTYFRSTEQDDEFVSVLEAAGYDVDSPTKGWERFVEHPMTIHDIPGLHEKLLFPPSVYDLAKALRASIDDAIEKV